TSARVTQLIYLHADVILGNALDHDRRDYYDLVIGNPPYVGKRLKRKKSMQRSQRGREYIGESRRLRL
ncbi:hypothetical protein P7H16_23400, partial [Paenibacillus larvae]